MNIVDMIVAIFQARKERLEWENGHEDFISNLLTQRRTSKLSLCHRS